MTTATTPRLQRHRVFQSRDPDETVAFVTSRDFRFDLHGPLGSLDVHVNAAYLPNSYVGYVCYGSAVELRATPSRLDYRVQFPLERRFELSVADRGLLCDAHRGAVLSPMHDNRMRAEPGCARFILSLSNDAVVQQLAALLGGPLSTPLEFAPELDLTTGCGRSLARYVGAAAGDLDESDSLLTNSLAMCQFEQFVITGLLLHQPHNYSAALRRERRSVASRDVKRAIDYIDAHLQTPITLGHIVQASGVAGRTLLKHFRDLVGLSPMAYLRKARFGKVRQALIEAGPEQSVSAIAASWGFDHLSRFAAEYHRRFGERPSDTLRRPPSPARRYLLL